MSFTAEYITRLIANTVVTSQAGRRDAYGFTRLTAVERALLARPVQKLRDQSKGCDPYNRVGKRA